VISLIPAPKKTKPPVIIGIGGGIDAGKTTVSEYLQDKYGFIEENFSDPIKDMLSAMGLDEYDISGPGKEEPNHEILCGKTPRFAMRTLGTEWGRGFISSGVWTMHWVRRAQMMLSEGHSVVEAGTRFPDEVNTLRGLGGKLWYIEKLEAEKNNKDHVSELHNIRQYADHIIVNNGTLADLYRSVDAVLLKMGVLDE
jgi:hypothetical protein